MNSRFYPRGLALPAPLSFNVQVIAPDEGTTVATVSKHRAMNAAAYRNGKSYWDTGANNSLLLQPPSNQLFSPQHNFTMGQEMVPPETERSFSSDERGPSAEKKGGRGGAQAGEE